MSKEVATIKQNKAGSIPQLDDPKHPGMHLVSRIALFSLSLFMLLFALLAITGNRVMLNFELDATANFQQEQLWLTMDEQKAAVFTAGNEVVIQYEDGRSINATVAQLGLPAKGKLTMLVAIRPGEDSTLQAGARDISLHFKQPLKDFMMGKLFP